MSKNRYGKKNQDQDSDIPQRDPHRCAAYGCPLRGTMSNSLNGSDTWYCRFHNGRNPADFDAISTRINRHQALIEHHARVSSAGPIRGIEVQTGNALHRRAPGETYNQHLRRLTGLIFDAIHGGGPANSSEDAAA